MKKFILAFVCFIFIIYLTFQLLPTYKEEKTFNLTKITSSLQGKGEIRDGETGRKITLDKIEMKKVFDVLEKIQLTKTEQKRELGWMYLIHWDIDVITMTDNRLRVNGVEYKANTKALKKIIEDFFET